MRINTIFDRPTIILRSTLAQALPDETIDEYIQSCPSQLICILPVTFAGDEEGRAEDVVDVGRVNVTTINVLQCGAIFPQLKREACRPNGLWAQTTSNGSQIELCLEYLSVKVVAGVESEDIVHPFARKEKRSHARQPQWTDGHKLPSYIFQNFGREPAQD